VLFVLRHWYRKRLELGDENGPKMGLEEKGPEIGSPLGGPKLGHPEVYILLRRYSGTRLGLALYWTRRSSGWRIGVVLLVLFG
jgi:hypothetical protein